MGPDIIRNLLHGLPTRFLLENDGRIEMCPLNN